MILAFIKGIILSFGLVIPIGTQNLFVFNQAMAQEKFRRVLPVIIAVTLCDAFLILLSVLGVDLFLNINWFKISLLIGGIVSLLYAGYNVWKSASDIQTNEPINRLSTLKQIIFAISITLLNPHAIMDLFVIVGSVSVEYEGLEKQAFIMGCIFLETIWFTTLSLSGFHLKRLKNAERISFFINKISALIMWFIAALLTNQLFHMVI